MEGLASDGGLYIPKNFPKFSSVELENMINMSYEELCVEVIFKYCGTCLTKEEIKIIALDSYKNFGTNDIAPIIKVTDNINILELFHGPTLAFKDFALQFLSRVFNILLEREGKKITIIGATSGDTGSAAIEAFKNNSLANIIILHPEGKVSDFQRKQMTTVDAGNIYNIAIDGNFDDCQALVKKLLVDKDFNNKHNLASINSINWGRVLAQVVYYFYSAFKVMKGKDNKSVNFSVPTGNFGDAYAGYVAKKMGLPIEKIIIATNSNDILSNFFKNGIYKISKVIPTISPSMDIQLASNFERLLYETLDHDPSLVREYMKTLSNIGSFKISNEKLKTLNETFIGLGVSDEATIERIKSTYNNNSLVIDPHTSVGLEAAYNYNYSLKGPCIVLSTAHPVKFADAVSSAININSDLPEKYKNIFSLDEKYHSLKNNLDTIKNFIDSTSNV
jgi:threonine synthase